MFGRHLTGETMKNTPLRVAYICAAIGIFAGCSYVVSADRSKIPDDLFQPSVLPEAAAEADAADETTGGDAEEEGDDGEAQATDEGGDEADAADDGVTSDESATGEAATSDANETGAD
jgi:hypothetical protein